VQTHTFGLIPCPLNLKLYDVLLKLAMQNCNFADFSSPCTDNSAFTILAFSKLRTRMSSLFEIFTAVSAVA